ncbi:MAG: hypothetical protein H6737_10560 [Alphaproteobacteria bacterium]|nr:hypothetical protein [Alphaproteobacteria bacterium]
MAMKWRVGPGVRCDLVAYAGKNLNGKRLQVQLFPTGARKGTLLGNELSSLVIRALPGTRVILAASDNDAWENAAWRCIRMVPGNFMRSEQRNGLPGVRIPDLDMMDAYTAKKTATDFEASYPYVDRLADGEGWTFGRGGGLKNRVAMVIVDREDVSGRVPTPGEVVASAILGVLRERWPDAVPDALDAAEEALRHVVHEADVDERIADLREG